MLFQCNQCGKNLKVSDSVAGRKVRCPSCQAVLTAPAAESPGGSANIHPTDTRRQIQKPREVPPEGKQKSEAIRPARSGSPQFSSSRPESRPSVKHRARNTEIPERRKAFPSLAPSPRKPAETSVRRARRVSDSDDEISDDLWSGTDQADDYGSGYDNPYAPPDATGGHRRSDDESKRQMRLVGAGLLLAGWCFVVMMLIPAGGMVAAFVTGISAAMTEGPNVDAKKLSESVTSLLIGPLLFVVVCCYLGVLAGHALCINVPIKTGARGYAIAFVSCLGVICCIQVLKSVITDKALNVVLALLAAALLLTYVVLLVIFVRKVAGYLKRGGLIQMSTIVVAAYAGTVLVLFGSLFLAGIAGVARSEGLLWTSLIGILLGFLLGVVSNIIYAVTLIRLGFAARAA